MKNVYVMMTVFVVAGSLAVSGAFAADQKIAVCDVGKILKEYPDAQAADEAIKKQKDEYEVEGKKLMDDYEKKKDQLIDFKKDADSKALSDEEREKRLQTLDVKQMELRSLERQIRETMELRQKQLQDFGMRANKRIVAKVRETIATYAKLKGYTLVIAKGGSIDTILYSADSIDITEETLKLFKDIPTEKAPAKKE